MPKKLWAISSSQSILKREESIRMETKTYAGIFRSNKIVTKTRENKEDIFPLYETLKTSP